MSNYPKSFQNLVDQFRRLPQVGNKAAIRFAYAILAMDDMAVKNLADAMVEAKANLHNCEICHNMCEEKRCVVCVNPNRDNTTICVVTSSKDVLAMESIGNYQGVYHVLGGEISPSKGVLPEDLNLTSLIGRINTDIKEVIIATNSTIDGEITALYISKLLNGFTFTVSRLAHGIPMGGQLDYADERTLLKAMQGRTKY